VIHEACGSVRGWKTVGYADVGVLVDSVEIVAPLAKAAKHVLETGG
jgi:hypothetical protein